MSSSSNYNRKITLNSPDLTVTRCGTSLLKPKPNHFSPNPKNIGLPGQGLHNESSKSIQQSLLLDLSKLLSRLSEPEDFKPPLVELSLISESHLLTESLPLNSYSKISSIPSHQLLYKTHKAEVKLVRSILEHSGFFYTDSHYWNLLWSCTPLQPYVYEGLNPYQKINHFPCSNELTRKDRMCINLNVMKERYGKEHFDFAPDTWVLPDEFSGFYSRYQSEKKSLWIVKPSCSSQGRGIFLVNNIHEVPIDESCIISKYISDPYLINGLKFDIRLYVLVSSFEPLRIYLFEEGLVRFASEKYEGQSKRNKYVHLTNYSVNKNNENFIQNTDAAEDGVGHKWSLKALMKYFREKNVDTEKLWGRIYDMIVKSILSIETLVLESSKKLNVHRNNCFDLFGFDVLLDSELKPWLLEVNLSPSLATDSPLDFYIKSHLLTDTFNLIGIRMKQNRNKVAKTYTKLAVSKMKNSPYLVTKLKAERRSSQKLQEIIRESVEEYSRKSGFLMIFPCKGGEYYDQFFNQPRQINRILNNLFFSETPDLSVLMVKVMRTLPPTKKICTNSSFESEIEVKRLQSSIDSKVRMNGDDLLIEYLQRLIQYLPCIENLPLEAREKLEKFIKHHTWRLNENCENSIEKNLELRIKEMVSRRFALSSSLQNRLIGLSQYQKSRTLKGFSDDELVKMLRDCNKEANLEIIDILVEGTSVHDLIKDSQPKKFQISRIKSPLNSKDFRHRSIPKRPHTSVKTKSDY